MRPKNQTASINVILRKGRKNSKGEYPIIIRYVLDRKTAIQSVGFTSLESHWDIKTQRPNPKHPNSLRLSSLIDEKVKEIKDRMIEFTQKGQKYSISLLRKEVIKEHEPVPVFDFFDRTINRLEDAGRTGTAESYKTTKHIIKLFTKDSALEFSDINYSFLIELETYLLKRPKLKKDTTLFFYFKTFRALINRGVKEKCCEKLDYGFGDFKLTRYNLKTRKRAISMDAITMIEKLELKPYSADWNARNYFLFSYYVRGINMVDICHLTENNIVSGRLEYERIKVGGHFSIKINSKAQEIIEHYQSRIYGQYLFPVFTEKHDTPTKMSKRVASLRSSIGKALKRIAIKCKLNCHLVFYSARHSYASGLKRKGASIVAIKELLGHGDHKTTEIYLEELDVDTLDEFDDLLYKLPLIT